MASNELYQAALTFRKTKLWNKLLDDQLFAVSLSNGQIGYCCVMGAMGEHLALGLYIGNKGLQSYYLLRRPPVLGCPSLLHQQEVMFSQDCLQCSFESMSMLSKEECMALRTYTKQHQISLRGKNACPQFTKYRTARPFFPVANALDDSLLTQALLAALAVDQRVMEEGSAWLEPLDMDRTDQVIPLLTPTKDGFQWSWHNLPPMIAKEYPVPVLKDELLLGRLKRTRKSRSHLVLDVVMMPTAVMNPELDANVSAYFPYLLMGICAKTQELIMLPELADGYDLERAERLLSALGHWMLEQGVPAKITAYNQRTYSLLQNLAQQLNIRLYLEADSDTEELFLLLNAENDLAAQADGPYEESGNADDELDLLFDFLATADDYQLRTIPDFIWHQLVDGAKQGVFPPEFAQRILRLKR